MVRSFCAVLLLVFLAVPQANACVCVESGSARDQIRAAQIVVIGRVVGLELRIREIEGERVEQTVATIEVARRWKGPDQARIEVSTCGNQALICTCGVHFDLGGTLIVVTERENQVSSCGLTRMFLPGDDPLLAEIENALSE